MAVNKSHILVGALAGAGVAVAAMAGIGMRPAGPAGQTPSGLLKADFSPAPGAPQSFADIFAKVSPAVVSVNVVSKADSNAMGKIIPGAPGFNFPFEIIPRGQNQDQGPPPTQLSSGSGFFISPDGYIVTNNHVIENAEKITVVTKDGKELPATLIGHDEDTDLAVIKVQGHDFPYVQFEDRARPRVGDWVLAVGNPFSLGDTATAGIVSANGRDIGQTFVDYIQIDAPINRGNSGGPTFDIYGRVIGVNTAIFSPSGGSVGIGLDIPADVAQRITTQLMEGRTITRGYLGATIQNLNDEMANAFGLAGRKGAVVAELVPGGPAARAGLQPGDVVVSVDGTPVTDSTEMTREVAKAHAGDNIHLQLYRDGKEMSLNVRSGTRPSDAVLAQNGFGGDEEQQGGEGGARQAAPQSRILGMSLAPLSPQARQEFSIGDEVHGVVVDSVSSASDAGEKGLRRGDVIVRAGDRQVASAGDVSAAVAQWKKDGRTSIPIAVDRAGRTIFVPIKIAG